MNFVTYVMPWSITNTMAVMIKVVTMTTIVLSRSCSWVGQETFFISFDTSVKKFFVSPNILYLSKFVVFSTGGRNRTRSLRFWRPLLYQLSYTRMLELMTGIEPVTSTLPRWCSTN